LATGEAGLQESRERLATDTSAVQARLDEAGRREEALGRDQANLSNAREKFQAEQRELLEFKRSIDSRVSAVEEKETEMDRLSKDVAAREARVVPEEARLAERANVAEQKEADLKAREDRLTARTQTLDGREQELSSREVALNEDRVVLAEARGAFESDRREFEERKNQADEEARRRRSDLDGQAKTVGASQLRLAKGEEAKAAEERRTWQTTLQSEQALLKDQRDAFEQEAASARASWADRVMRIEAREVDLEEKEEKVRTDVDWVARSDEDLKRREKA